MKFVLRAGGGATVSYTRCIAFFACILTKPRGIENLMEIEALSFTAHGFAPTCSSFLAVLTAGG